MCVAQCAIEMELLNKSFAFNTTPCSNAMHRIRTRSGHCIQCHHASIQFQRRASMAGIIYIAASEKAQRIKIGFTEQNISNRESKLKSKKYGGYSDWKIIYAVYSDFAGRHEISIKSILEKYSYKITYDSGNQRQNAHEIFSCSFNKAKHALDTVTNIDASLRSIFSVFNFNKYEFRNLVGVNNS